MRTTNPAHAGSITLDNRLTPSELPALTDEKIWKGTGGNVEEVDWPDLATHAGLTTAHGAVSAATPNKIVVRDAAGRSKVVAPSAEDDIALKSNVTTVNSALTDHAALTTAHGAVSAATASKIVVRDVAGRAKFVAGAAAGDALIYEQIPTAGIWTLLETLSPAAVVSISSSVLTAYDLFLVQIKLAVSNSDTFCMVLNDDTGTNYRNRFLATSTTINENTNRQAFYLAAFTNAQNTTGELLLNGKLGAARVPIACRIACTQSGCNVTLEGDYNAAANITKFTFKTYGGAYTITGKIQIYGKNFP